MRTIPTTLATLGMVAVLGSVHATELHGLQEPGQPQILVEQVVEGQVTQVNEEELSIRTEEGETVTFHVDAATEVREADPMIPEAEVREEVTDLAPGDQVVIHFRAGEDPEERVAVAIEVRSQQDSDALWQSIGLQPGERMDEEIQPAGAEQEIRGSHDDPVAGRIAEVNGDEVTVRTEEGESKTFQMDLATRVTDATGQEIQTEAERLAALTVGTEVVVHARADETTEEPIAEVIEVRNR